MTRLDHLFPDRRSYVLWPLALAWMAVFGFKGGVFFRMGFHGTGTHGLIFGGILMAFSPLPVALLLTRQQPDLPRRRDLLDRQEGRLALRLVREGASPLGRGRVNP